MPVNTTIPFNKFSAKEIRILNLLNEGYSLSEIAGKLFCCESTIISYRRKIIKKAGTKYIIAPAERRSKHGSLETNSKDQISFNGAERKTILKVIRGGLYGSVNNNISVIERNIFSKPLMKLVG